MEALRSVVRRYSDRPGFAATLQTLVDPYGRTLWRYAFTWGPGPDKHANTDEDPAYAVRPDIKPEEVKP